MTNPDDIDAILTAAGVPHMPSTTADRVRWLVADRDGAVECRHHADETCALLYSDVAAQRRVIFDACALLGVCEDSEDDWTKLPRYVEQMREERDALRARLARVVPVIEALAAACDECGAVITRDCDVPERQRTILARALGGSSTWTDKAATLRALIADEVPRG